jgi:hypothetical protein
MVWSNNKNWMITGDDGGAIKYGAIQFYTTACSVHQNCHFEQVS